VTLAAQRGDCGFGVDFFRTEYILNYLIARLAFGLPDVALECPHPEEPSTADAKASDRPVAPGSSAAASSDRAVRERRESATSASSSASGQTTLPTASPPPQASPAQNTSHLQPHGGERRGLRAAAAPVALVALMDGMTMGGGGGLCMNGAFRIATERCARPAPCSVSHPNACVFVLRPDYVSR
jgi:Enoyl-CoA hydratase/isomerase